MKRCPECRRDYYDDTLLYCLDDGSALLEGPGAPSTGDEPATAILHSTAAPGEAATRAQIHTTEQTAVLPSGKGDMEKRAFDKRTLAAPFLLGIAVLGGFFGYRYFQSAGTQQITSIAVMPFVNAGGDADSEYLSDGIAESLIYRLSQIPDLKVSPRSSVFRYKGKDIDAEKVGSELGVDAVMSGRIIQRGDSLTISVDLVDVRNKKTLWGEQFERKMSDLLSTQREIAAAITERLQLKLSGSAGPGATKRYTDNNEAYQAYLKGRYYWNRRTGENVKKAIEQFKTATDLDPNFALAYAGLADCYAILPEYAGTPSTETLPRSKAYAERAIAIDGQLAEPHATLGQVHDQSWQWVESEREYKRAIELNPNYATAYHWYSILLRGQGRVDEAAENIRRAHELDPISSVIGMNLSEIYRIQGDENASVANTLRVIELDPTFSYAYDGLGLSYLKQGRNAEAIANLEKAVELSNRAGVRLRSLGYGYGVTGKRAEALAVAKELEEKYARGEALGQYVAAVYAGLGDKDKAFEWLEKNFKTKEDLASIRWRVPYEPLRDDPRFKDLLRRMNLPE